MNRQPVLTVGAITALVVAVVAVLVAAGVPVSNELKIALVGLVAAAAPIVSALIARRKVTPSAEVVAVAGRHRSGAVAGPASPLPDGTPVGVTSVGPPPT